MPTKRVNAVVTDDTRAERVQREPAASVASVSASGQAMDVCIIAYYTDVHGQANTESVSVAAAPVNGTLSVNRVTCAAEWPADMPSGHFSAVNGDRSKQTQCGMKETNCVEDTSVLIEECKVGIDDAYNDNFVSETVSIR